MTKTTQPTARQIAAAEKLRVKEAADRQAEADAATAALRALVAKDSFKTAFADMKAAIAVAPANIDLGYAVSMMDRLRSQFAG